MVTYIAPKSLTARGVEGPRHHIIPIDGLIDEMEKTWKAMPPPMTGLGHFAITGRTFTRIRDGYRSEFLSDVLPESVLFDLGAGMCGPMMEFAGAYSVRRYVAVDRYCAYPDGPIGPGIDFVNDDMLRFLLHQPDASGNIVINAIDDIMLSSGNPATDRMYLELLAIQMARVVPAGGIAFGYNSAIFDSLQGHGFAPVLLNERYGISSGACLMRGESQ